MSNETPNNAVSVILQLVDGSLQFFGTIGAEDEESSTQIASAFIFDILEKSIDEFKTVTPEEVKEAEGHSHFMRYEYKKGMVKGNEHCSGIIINDKVWGYMITTPLKNIDMVKYEKEEQI